MSNTSEKRLRQLIQRQNHARPLPNAVTDETAALCALVDELTREMVALRKRVFKIETGRDCA